MKSVIPSRNPKGREPGTHSASPIFEKVGLEPNAFEMVFCFTTPRMNPKAMRNASPTGEMESPGPRKSGYFTEPFFSHFLASFLPMPSGVELEPAHPRTNHASPVSKIAKGKTFQKTQ
jgi:hypothetical protein